MVKTFKFFIGNEKRIDWEVTGLLDGATNVPLLNGVLDITYKYIVDNDLLNNQTILTMLLPIMTRLYRDKVLSYSDYDIRDKINHVVDCMNGTAIRRIMQEIQSNAYSSIDIEAETCAIVTDNCNWEEDYGF